MAVDDLAEFRMDVFLERNVFLDEFMNAGDAEARFARMSVAVIIADMIEIIAIVKDSSLASAIGLADLAYAARTVSGAYATYWEPYLTISLVYWVITFLLAQLVNRLEKRFGKSDPH